MTSNDKVRAMVLERLYGPQQVGGIYWCGYWSEAYEVLAIDSDPQWPNLTVRTLGQVKARTHCTAWDPRGDRVLAEPGEAALTYWADFVLSAASTYAAVVEQRHVLAEAAHPEQVAALVEQARRFDPGADAR
ncbi:hypothetical protein ACIRPK_20705 [Kitasatospora sp. NPDC101801]|uniref:hypothetical protein n=1 Tax=Kitasatospora sp. NPDC101801 TaxID=3364103 RepID=UPI0037FA019F